jgi:phage-related minor tail protein
MTETYYKRNKEKVSKRIKDRYKDKKEDILSKKKEYYKRNKEKIKNKRKEYCENNKNKVISSAIKYREKNRIKLNKKKLEYKKRTNYKTEKTPLQIKNREVRKQTRKFYPLLNKKCDFCDNKSTQHHHYTKPYVFDKFWYVCDDCHKKLHNLPIIEYRKNKTRESMKGGLNGR